MVGSSLTNKAIWHPMERGVSPQKTRSLFLIFDSFKNNVYQWDIFYNQRKREIILVLVQWNLKKEKKRNHLYGDWHPNQLEDKSHSEPRKSASLQVWITRAQRTF